MQAYTNGLGAKQEFLIPIFWDQPISREQSYCKIASFGSVPGRKSRSTPCLLTVLNVTKRLTEPTRLDPGEGQAPIMRSYAEF